MGMFDDVRYEMRCPTCGQPVKGFQSKDGACEMATVEPRDVRQFYASCNNCKTWIQCSVHPPIPAYITAEYTPRGVDVHVLIDAPDLPNRGLIEWHPQVFRAHLADGQTCDFRISHISESGK